MRLAGGSGRWEERGAGRGVGLGRRLQHVAVELEARLSMKKARADIPPKCTATRTFFQASLLRGVSKCRSQTAICDEDLRHLLPMIPWNCEHKNRTASAGSTTASSRGTYR